MRLRTYVIRRLLFAIFAFFLASLLIFAFVSQSLDWRISRSTSPMYEEMIRRLTVEWGFDKPFFTRYLIWMSRFLQGDFGFSLVKGESVSGMIAQRLPYTLELMFIAQIVSVATAIVLGVISVLKKHSLVSSVSSLGARIVYLTPHFWIALMAMEVLAVTFRWLPARGTQTLDITFASPIDAWVDHLAYLMPPTLILAVIWTPYYFLKMKSSMLGVLKQDYITTARTKGQKERVVVLKHALGNALLTLLKHEGYLIGLLISSAVVIEYMFAWPGLFHLFIHASYNRDVFAIWGVSLTIVLMVLFVSFCTDITYRILNPRTRRTPN